MKFTRSFLPVFLFCLSFPASSSAIGNTYSDFMNADASDLKPFAKDIGGLLGSGSNHTARSLGFSGFDVGVRSVIQLKPDTGNKFMDKDRGFGLGWLQAEIGMPYRIDGFVRAGSYDGIAVSGGGIRYGLRKISDEPYYIQVMFTAMANMANHKYFYATHFSSNFVFSINAPYLAPFLSVGLDNTSLVVQNSNDPALVGKRVNVVGNRMVFGLRTKFSLGYVSAAIGLLHTRAAIQCGSGMRF